MCSNRRNSEIAVFCVDLPVGRRWVRQRGPGGEDVIKIEGESPGLIRLKKA
jgi:hypothetical protein